MTTSDDDDPGRRLVWLSRSNVALFVLLTLGSLYLGEAEITLGVLLGGLISVINFVALRRIGSSLLVPGARGLNVAVKLVSKFIFMFGSVAAVLIWCPVDPLAFLVGISITVMSVCFWGIAQIFAVPREKPESTDA